MKRKWPQAKKAKFFLNLGRLLRRGYTLNHGAKLLSYNGGDIAKARTDEWLLSLEEGKRGKKPLRHYKFQVILKLICISQNDTA
ncbi:hypothetical protein JCM19037_1692 [Geomicrobium sp. JCM 19037]|nr:hypothetical protein JCM19037_1692 [Geomicrobium sp. JCM 19037]